MGRKREVWGYTPGQPWTSEPQKSLRTRRPSSELPPGQVRTSEHARVLGRQDLPRGQVWMAELRTIFLAHINAGRENPRKRISNRGCVDPAKSYLIIFKTLRTA